MKIHCSTEDYCIHPKVKRIRFLRLARLAKIAYEAYCETKGWKSAVTGADLPPFDKTPLAVQEGWMAAAEAVFDEVRD